MKAYEDGARASYAFGRWQESILLGRVRGRGQAWLGTALTALAVIWTMSIKEAFKSWVMVRILIREGA